MGGADAFSALLACIVFPPYLLPLILFEWKKMGMMTTRALDLGFSDEKVSEKDLERKREGLQEQPLNKEDTTLAPFQQVCFILLALELRRCP